MRMSCDRVRRLVFRLLARDLTPVAERAVRAHLRGCPHCFARAEHARMLRALAARGAAARKAPRRVAAAIRRIIAASR